MNFYNDGILFLQNENLEFHRILMQVVQDAVGCSRLDEIHHTIEPNRINAARLDAFKSLNSIESWELSTYNMGKSFLDRVIGPDILIQRKLNISIQMPKDGTSVLGMHMDTLSGQTPFEVVMWVPLTDAFSSNGMYYFDREVSKEIRSQMQLEPRIGLEYFREKFWSKRKIVEVASNTVVFFSGTLFHGNVENETNKTRVSINTRFKNLYSPEAIAGIHERGVGVFYKLLKCSDLTLVALEYSRTQDTF